MFWPLLFLGLCLYGAYEVLSAMEVLPWAEKQK